MAQLDALAFEGATKRSKPNLKVCLSLLSRHLIHSQTDIGLKWILDKKTDDRSAH
jgi:hypothetical protein